MSDPPFQCKGLVYRGAHEFYEERVPGGVKALADKLEIDDREFFMQPFLPGGWYDVLPIARISQTAAKLAGIPSVQLVRENAARLAHRDVNGVYRILLKLASPELVASRLPRASLQYFDFGTADGTMTGPKQFVARRHGVPLALATWMSSCIEGFVPVALEYAGAKQVTVRAHTHDDGQRAGQRLVRIELRITWE